MVWRALFSSFAMLALAAPAAGAGDGALDRATLRSLAAFNVVVDKIAPELQSEGVTEDVVRARIEDKLRAANIAVDQKKPEFLALRIQAVRAARGPFAVAVTLGAYQPVTLARDPKIRTATETWEVETVLLADSKQLYRAAMDTIDELARGFVAAYRSVNAQ